MRLASLSYFLFYMGDKPFLFFAALRKKEIFEWTTKCEEAFTKIEDFLIPSSILTRSKDDSPLLLYRLVTKRVMSLVLVQEIDKAEKPMYFVRKLFKGTKMLYQKIEKLALAIVTTTRNSDLIFKARHPGKI